MKRNKAEELEKIRKTKRIYYQKAQSDEEAREKVKAVIRQDISFIVGVAVTHAHFLGMSNKSNKELNLRVLRASIITSLLSWNMSEERIEELMTMYDTIDVIGTFRKFQTSIYVSDTY